MSLWNIYYVNHAQLVRDVDYVKTAETVCYEIFREILRYARAFDSKGGFTVVAHPAVIDRLLTAEAPAVADLEHFINRVIKFQVENLYTQEQYDIILKLKL